ncbi:phosphatase PAP2/dual specificity phosphatase family protein [Paludibaculum fermentans]|uniref:phosphatase PAP2/dual specificity phosphatase family protein n=1 Tax=Paludibaculum fermentans TaxID=1473598 RepID=UPI003EB79CB4
MEGDPKESRPWLPALLWLAVLGPLFFLSYGFANWVTGLRENVPEVAFAWERHIPFWAWTIVPYWSTDLFYAVSVFLCRTRNELRTHVSRLIVVQLVCVTGFLAAPLQFGFERPVSEGFFGGLFDALMSFDKPFNQAPSLHIALITVLWARYARHFGGATMWLLRIWFVLMAVSTLTTYQHHFIDLPAGLWVGLLAMALFPEEGWAGRLARSRDPRRFALGAAYLAGGLICALAAYLMGGLGWLLAWPAAALVLVAGFYWYGQPGLFGKAGGAMAPAALSLVAPYVAGAWLSSRWFTRGQATAHEIAEGVWLGRFPSRSELAESGMASVVDVTAELPFAGRGVEYRSVPMLDLLAPGAEQLDAAVEAIEELSAERPTLVCCALGYSRSAAAVAAWLVATGRALSVDAAIEMIRARRPVIVLGATARRALTEWAAGRASR